MDHNLAKLTAIGGHLIYLTTHDPYGCSRSKGIDTIAELAQELNAVRICPKRGYWTSHSLECFFSRCRRRYDQATLISCTDWTMIGVSDWEYITGRTKQKTRRKRRPMHVGSSTRSPGTRRYQCIEGERWKEHEETALFQEAAKLKQNARNSKIFSGSESFL